jgi:glyoxylase-like metal-dependent hydrolase (beta-lactamase superfamily II)
MKIINLTEHSNVYTANVYFVLGTWNSLPDVNTLVDVGRDPSVIQTIKTTSTGVGKKRVEQVILTHSHYDHAGLLPIIRATFKPVVYAFSRYLEGVDRLLKDGDTLKLGDRMFEIIYTPGHSTDSICLYCEEEGVLFAGDTPLIIHRPGDTYQKDFVYALEKLCRKDIRAIYFGHGQPILKNCNPLLRTSLENVRKSLRVTMK